MAGPESVEEYLAAQPEAARQVLTKVRDTIRAAAPQAREGISYQIPVFKVDGKALVWFAGFKDHYSLYPATDRLKEELGEELKPHLSGRGTLRFSFGEPVPSELISRIVVARLAEQAASRG